jgi:hypothetical protein
MPDPKAKPAPVLSEEELRQLREHADCGCREQLWMRLLAEHSQLKREVELLRPLWRLVCQRDCCDGSNARRTSECQEKLDAIAAFDAAKPGACTCYVPPSGPGPNYDHPRRDLECPQHGVRAGHGGAP